MSTVADLDLTIQQQQAFDLIQERQELTQSKLWKELDANSRAGSRLATALAEKGLIERTEITQNGQRTYLLTPTEPDQSPPTESSTDQSTADQSPANDTTPSGNTSTQDETNSRDERALALIQQRGSLYQSQLWKELDVSSRTGSRIAKRLEDDGAIRREETTHNGNRTYLLRPAKRDLDFSLLMAGDMLSPLIGDEEGTDPVDSDEFTEFVLRLAQQ